MDNRIKTGLALALCVSLAGCANNEIKPGEVLCPIVGAVTGAGVAAAAAGSDEPEAYVAGAALGAGLGYLFCHEKKVPPPPAPTPAPAPAPAPPPPPPPPPAPAEPEVGSKIISLEGANFDFNKATLKPEGMAKLDQAAAVMAEHADLTVGVEGHTDSVGSDAYNQKLSERRAQAAVDYLVSKGVDASRLQPTGYGESKPVASNDTAEGRAQNRRVDLVVTGN
jgi:OOP family OmpA-OmpF porin